MTVIEILGGFCHGSRHSRKEESKKQNQNCNRGSSDAVNNKQEIT